MNPPHVTPVEEKSLEDRAPRLCLKHFVGAEMARAQGSQPGQTGQGQKMKDGCLLNLLYAIVSTLTSINSVSPGTRNF